MQNEAIAVDQFRYEQSEGRGFMIGEDSVRDLRIRPFEFARRIVRVCVKAPRNEGISPLYRQLLKAGTSPGANYREASRARSRAEFIAKLGDCLKELEETHYWLELMIAESVGPESDLQELLWESNELIAIFVTSINTAKRCQQ